MCAQRSILNFFKPATVSGTNSRNDNCEAECSSSTKHTDKSSNSDSPSTSSKHRVSGVNLEWKSQFPWLIFSQGKEEGMLCSICSKFATTGGPKRSEVWIKVPCSRMRRESIVDHAKSIVHQNAHQKSVEARELELSGVGQIERRVSTVSNLQRDAFIGALKTVYFLAQNELSYTTLYKKLLDFCMDMGCKYLQHLNVAKNATYTSEQIIQELLEVIAAKIRTKIITNISGSEYYSVICDETTDISVTKQLIVYVKYISKSLGPSVSFLEVVNLQDGKAQTIANAVIAVLHKHGLPLEKLIGLGSDGAAVMVGQRNGVAKILKDKTEGLLVNCHCIAHRLALASAEAANEIPYLRKFRDILRQLFYFFQNSAVRMAGFTALQKLLETPEIKLKQANDTRWLSHDAAVQALRRSLVTVVTALEREATERNDAAAVGLSKFIKIMISFHCYVADVFRCFAIVKCIIKVMAKRRHGHHEY